MSVHKRFIFISRHFYPACTGIPRLVSDIAFDLAKEHSVIVLTNREGYENTQARHLKKHETIHNVNVFRIPIFPFKRNNLIGRLINYGKFYLSCLWYLWRLIRPNDIVIVLSEPPLVATFVTPLTKLYRAKLINWIQDIHPEISMYLGLPLMQGFPSYFLKFIRNIAWKNGFSNIVLGEKMAQYVQSQIPTAKQINIYPNWEDGSLIQQTTQQNNILRAAWGLENKFIIGYSGNLGRAHEFDTILETAVYFANQSAFNDIVFLFIGEGYYKEKLIQQVAQKKLTNVLFKPYQPREQLSISLTLPHIHFISTLPHMEDFLLPSKLYSAMAAGVPILFVGNLEGDVAKTLTRATCGMTIERGNSPALIAAILKLRNDPILRGQWGLNARLEFDKYFDKSVAMSKLSNFLMTI